MNFKKCYLIYCWGVLVASAIVLLWFQVQALPNGGFIIVDFNEYNEHLIELGITTHQLGILQSNRQ